MTRNEPQAVVAGIETGIALDRSKHELIAGTEKLLHAIHRLRGDKSEPFSWEAAL